MVLMRMRDDDAEQIVAVFLEEADVGEHQVDAGKVRAGEADAEINGKPLPVPLRAQAIDGKIHPDFADPAEGEEDELVRSTV